MSLRRTIQRFSIVRYPVLTTISLVLAGSLSAFAEETPEAAASATDVEKQRPAFRWSDAKAESALLRQAQAVFAVLRAQAGLENDDVTIVTVANADSDTSSSSDNCDLMPIPGSRIRAVRCYFPSEGEKALNQYQFQEEIRQTRQQQDILRMEQAEVDRRRAEIMIYGQ